MVQVIKRVCSAIIFAGQRSWLHIWWSFQEYPSTPNGHVFRNITFGMGTGRLPLSQSVTVPVNETMCSAHHVSWTAVAGAMSHSPHVLDRQKPWLAQTQLLVSCSKLIRVVMSPMTLRGVRQGAERNFDLSESDSKWVLILNFELVICILLLSHRQAPACLRFANIKTTTNKTKKTVQNSQEVPWVLHRSPGPHI